MNNTLDHYPEHFNEINYDKQLNEQIVSMLISNFGDGQFQYIIDKIGASVIDFHNIDTYTSDNIAEFVRYIVGDENINESDGNFFISKEGFDIISELLEDASKYYKNLFHRDIPKSFCPNKSGYKFNGFDDFFSFVKGKTSSNNLRNNKFRQITCSLLKISVVLSNIRKSGFLEMAENDYKQICDEYFDGNCDEFTKIKKSENDYRTLPNNTYGLYPVDFNLIGRPKSESSILLKMLSQFEYGAIESIKDLVGFKAEVSNEKEAIHLMEHIYYHFFSQDKHIGIIAKNKGLFDHKYFLENKYLFGQKFISTIQRDIVGKKSEKKPKTGDNYKDVKFTGPVKVGDKTINSVEFQIVLVNNNNESGYNAHSIMHGARVLESMIRLQGYITIAYMKRIIKEILEKNEEILPGLEIDVRIDKIFNEFMRNRGFAYLYLPNGKRKKQEKFIVSKNDFVRLSKNGFIPPDSLIEINDDSGYKIYSYDDLVENNN
ncbi:hypothetical protein [Candidatus Vampirococcus lugosii]|uniref:Restriction endonuclease n=1 Tax=Candidatus Vampirococcus lugosii TaxID=2789015 RepID=A0ABS5QKX5_9BACT|nr:hypothetical protein [Candidatus Vampirococcus lugosii]MBS8121433.1 hypothetical protein [Candidatus Vampirococcus lugosii]